MSLFSGLKSAIGGTGGGQGGGDGPGLLTYILGGREGADRWRKGRDEERRRGLFGAMPMPNSYAPPVHAAPNGEADPLADVPYAQRQQAWLADLARAGADVPLSALMPKEPDVKAVEGPGGIYERGPDGKWSLAQPYPDQIKPPPVGTLWKDPNDPSQGVVPLPGYLGAMGGVADVRAAAIARHRAPPRARASGGGRGGGGSSGLPAGFRVVP